MRVCIKGAYRPYEHLVEVEKLKAANFKAQKSATIDDVGDGETQAQVMNFGGHQAGNSAVVGTRPVGGGYGYGDIYDRGMPMFGGEAHMAMQWVWAVMAMRVGVKPI